MKRMWKKSLAFLLVMLLVVQLLPMGAMAAEDHAAPSGETVLVDAADENSQKLTNPLDGDADVQIAPDEVVTFLVELEAEPLIAYLQEDTDVATALASSNLTAKQAVNDAQGQARREMQALDGLEILDTYSLLLNGFAVSAPYEMRDTLAALPGVRAVEIAQTYEAPETQENTVESDFSSVGDIVNASSEYTGAGTLIGILDTGLDIDHEAFAASPETVAVTKRQVELALENLGFNAQGSVDDLYISEKIPFQYDYADHDTDVNDSQGHGTHVAGIAAADCETLTGIAPDAQLAIFKVFSDVESGTGDEWILPALEDAVKLGVDVINMSLGSACGFSSEGEIMDRVYNRIEDAGISLMVAAGNDWTSTENHPYGQKSLVSNPDNAMVGTPSTLDAALSVASVENVQKYVSYFQVGDQKFEYSDSNKGDMAFTSLDGTYEYVVIPGYGADSDYTGLDVTGKIALVMRGTLSFTEKEAAAAKAGAAGLVVYDNAPGALSRMQVEGLIPSCFITLENGDAMKAAQEKSLSISPSMSDFMENEEAGQISSFSSWGPGTSLTLKPEITAPGGHIYSSLPGGVYGDMSGTSMASPQMAGIAAGLRQYLDSSEDFADLSEYRKGQLADALLMSTAVPLEDPDGVLYSPRSQGAGLVNMNGAIQTRAYLTNDDGDIAKGELGSSETGRFTYSFYVHNFGSETLHYQLNTSILVPGFYYEDGVAFMSDQDRLLTEQEYKLTYSGDVDADGKLTVEPGSRASVTVQVDLTQTGISNLQVFSNGIYVEGFVNLEALDAGSVNLGAPFLGFYGNWYQAPILEPTVYEDETPLTGATQLGLFSYQDGSGFLLGQNMVTGEFEEKYNMVSSRQFCLAYGVSALVYQLRNAKTLRFTVTKDDTGEVYYSNVLENAIKSTWWADYGLFYYNSDYRMWDMTCEYEGGLISNVPDGAYTYTIEALGEGASEEDVQSVSIPLTVDSEGPELLSYEAVEENGVRYLDVELSDNYYLMGVQLTDENGEQALSEATYLAGDQPGETAKLRFDLTTALQMGYTTARVYMLDYAFNEVFSDVVSLSVGGFQPESITISPSQMVTSVGTTWQFTATVEPAEYLTEEQKQVTWSVSDESIASVTADGMVTGLKEGDVTLTATASNGVTGSTWLHFYQPEEAEYIQIPDQTEYTITESGLYQLPDAQSAQYMHITIDSAATEVTLKGNPDVTYQDLKVHCPGTVQLTLQDVHIALELESNEHGTDWNYYGAINFQAMDNILIVNGENSITRNAMNAGNVSAICVRAKKTEINSSVVFNGTGTMTIDTENPTGLATCFAAAIGGRQGERTGDMTFYGGTWIIRDNGFGAGIGSGSSSGSQNDTTLYTSKVTINNGTFDLETSHAATEVGACIGTGTSGYNGVEVVINGGDITATAWYGGAAIGSGMYGHSSSHAYGSSGQPTNPTTVTINGGTVRAYTKYHEDASAKSPGAAIGSGYRAGTYVPVAIHGGWVYAETNTESAAIGNGMSDRFENASITIDGGTVTAVTTAEGAAIGGGGGTTASTAAAAGIVTIAGGSVKAVSTGTGDAVGNAAGSQSTVHVWNNESLQVYEVPIPSAGCDYLLLDGLMRFSGDHTDDENHYLYLPEGTYYALVSGGTYANKSYDITVTRDGVTVREHGYVEEYSITMNLTNLTSDAPSSVQEGADLSLTLTPEKGYGLPEAIQVTMGGQMLLSTQYDYDNETGRFTLENVTGDVVLTAVAVEGVQTFSVTSELVHMTYEGPDYVSAGKTASGKLIPDEGYELPETISITMNGQAVQDYTYDRDSGAVAVPNVTGDVVISGMAQLAGGRSITYVVTHLTHDGAAEYVSGSDLEIQFTPEEGYVLPETVSVTGDQEIIRYTYNPDTGLLTILHATGNLTITAEGVSETAEPEPIDTTVLEALLESTKEAYEHPEDYEAGEAYDNFRAAYTAAAEVLEAPETQEQVDEAVKNLREAFEALTKISYAVITQDLKGVTSDAPKQVQVGSDLTVQLTADSGYLLPVSVTLSPAEAFQDAAYDADTGILTLQGVTGDLTIAAEGVPFAYADVAETHWFYDEVAYVTRWGLMNGMENNRFYPNNSMSRAMVATVLYRMAGSPEVTGTTPFTDVKEDRYYSDAVVWCYQNGITMGVTETRFGVDSTASRQQVATFLYRLADFMGYDVSETGDLSGFADYETVNPYAQTAVSWAVGTGLLKGLENNRLYPRKDCTRAQTATLLMRFCEMIMP